MLSVSYKCFSVALYTAVKIYSRAVCSTLRCVLRIARVLHPTHTTVHVC
jgi:hypothetical protein